MFYPMSIVSTGPLCLLVGACVHCLSSCLVYISGSVLLLGETIHPFGMCITYIINTFSFISSRMVRVSAIVTPSCFSINLLSNLPGDLVVTFGSHVHSEQLNSVHQQAKESWWICRQMPRG